jgi:hypothetical protein
MTPEALIRIVEDLLAEAGDAVVFDDGAVLFDLAQAKYSISGEPNQCLLHFWSEERNLVRRSGDVEVKKQVLRLAVQRSQQMRPHNPGRIHHRDTKARRESEAFREQGRFRVTCEIVGARGCP